VIGRKQVSRYSDFENKTYVLVAQESGNVASAIFYSQLVRGERKKEICQFWDVDWILYRVSQTLE
jgi:hypothetical protein